MLKQFLICTFLIFGKVFIVGGQVIRTIEDGMAINASFRALTVVDDSVVWIAGSKGWVGKSMNGGISWKFYQVNGFEKSDFRTLYAFDHQTAIIANAGSPGYVLRTKDGAHSWDTVYKNEHPGIFLDGIGFWNSKEGIIFGDPIGGRMTVLLTKDGGITWQEPTERPDLIDGEAAFAASGTSIQTIGSSKVVIATGGKVSRLWKSEDKGLTWKGFSTPMCQGESSTGIFSVAFIDEKKGVVVGGDYSNDTLRKDHIYLTIDGGETWQKPSGPTNGYRSCVVWVDENTLVATGTSGADISLDAGKNWNLISKDGYHVVKKLKSGKQVIMAGSGGRITIVIFE